jgi:hypothetical protein
MMVRWVRASPHRRTRAAWGSRGPIHRGREERVRACRANDLTIDRPAVAPFEQLRADGLLLVTPLRGPAVAGYRVS